MRQRFSIIVVLPVLIAIFLHCGGSRKIASEVQPLGFIPFLSENLSPDPAYLNQQLQRTLITSGSFNVIPLSTQPMVADLNTLHQLGDSSQKRNNSKSRNFALQPERTEMANHTGSRGCRR